MTKTAVLIGATGLVGNELLHKLLNSDRYTKVVTLSRRVLPVTHAKLVNHVIDFEKLTQYVELFKGDSVKTIFPPFLTVADFSFCNLKVRSFFPL